MDTDRDRKNMRTTPAQSPAGLKRLDPDAALQRGMMPPPPEDKGPLMKGRVARGRSVHLVDRDAPLEHVGYAQILIDGTSTLKAITRAPMRAAGPGETVELPAAEVARLRDLGFLEREDGRFMTHEAMVKAVTGIENDPRLVNSPSIRTEAPKGRDDGRVSARTRMER